MTVASNLWEHNLLSLAQHPADSGMLFPLYNQVADQIQLRQAYDHCDFLTAYHSKSFHLASGLLPASKRQAVRALYAFCRVSDDIVDRGAGELAVLLQQWRQKSLSEHPSSSDLVVLAWADARHSYRIPNLYAHQLLDGMARDLQQNRYETFADLTTYCYSVASTVGLMSMHIIGYQGAKAIPYAIKLGVALQLTNILRDVAEDFANGRIYLPQEELKSYGITTEEMAAGVVTSRWQAFMRFQIARNRQLYAEALPGIALLNQDGRLAIGAAAEFYRGILEAIEKRNYDVFTGRARLTGWNKLFRLPRIWWNVQQSRNG